jgi:hypothetical protein
MGRAMRTRQGNIRHQGCLQGPPAPLLCRNDCRGVNQRVQSVSLGACCSDPDVQAVTLPMGFSNSGVLASNGFQARDDGRLMFNQCHNVPKLPSINSLPQGDYPAASATLRLTAHLSMTALWNLLP